MTSTERNDSPPVSQGIAAGTTFVAAVLLFVAGLMGLFQGISAVADDDLIVVAADYVYSFNTTGWGWIHLVVGILAMIIAVGMIAGAGWARVAAIIIAAVSIVVNFLWLPYYPWWAVLLIVLDLIVIWAVATWRSDQSSPA